MFVTSDTVDDHINASCCCWSLFVIVEVVVSEGDCDCDDNVFDEILRIFDCCSADDDAGSCCCGDCRFIDIDDVNDVDVEDEEEVTEEEVEVVEEWVVIVLVLLLLMLAEELLLAADDCMF